MSPEQFPFLSSYWVRIISKTENQFFFLIFFPFFKGKFGSYFKEGMKLETICDFKNIDSFIEQMSLSTEYGKENPHRREFVMVGIYKILLQC